MLAFPVSVFAKPRGLACAVVVAFAAGTAVGWSAALPLAPDALVAEVAVTKPWSVRPWSTTPWPVKPDFDSVFASLNAPLPKQDSAKQASATPDRTKLAAVNFEEVFASFARESRDNTPSRREKLRNAGWRRLQSATQKPERVSAGDDRVVVN